VLSQFALTFWYNVSSDRTLQIFGGLNFFKPENEYHIQRIGKNNDGKPAYMTWGGLVDLNPFTSDKDIVDNQVVIIEFENNARATFHTNCNAGIPERRMYILGTEGAIRADVLTGTIQLKRIGFDTPIIDESTTAKGGHGNGDLYLAQELAASMLNDTPPSVGMPDALNSSITCFTIDQAMEQRKIIEMSNYWNKTYPSS